MLKKPLLKIKNQSGESISETLIALLISSLDLVMLAGEITSASRIIKTSREKVDAYYSQSEKMILLGNTSTAGGDDAAGSTETAEPGSVSIKSNDNSVSESPAVIYYQNSTFSGTPVIVFEKAE